MINACRIITMNTFSIPNVFHEYSTAVEYCVKSLGNPGEGVHSNYSARIYH